jgi:hypothetical protein
MVSWRRKAPFFTFAENDFSKANSIISDQILKLTIVNCPACRRWCKAAAERAIGSRLRPEAG